LCSTHVSAPLCNQTAGCSWNGSSCGGTVAACESNTGAIACSNEAGCAWKACTGSAAPCSTLSSVECSTQPGCTL
jgi:hypothetical protein